MRFNIHGLDFAMGQSPGTLVNMPEAFKVDYLRVVKIPKRVS